ncbi:hypothetical protein FACS1894214_3250 [Planctomycetales bacterium]|nr:hypothetical protein FACS1894214_3250 [Planctomycetales bacterium]
MIKKTTILLFAAVISAFAVCGVLFAEEKVPSRQVALDTFNTLLAKGEIANQDIPSLSKFSAGGSLPSSKFRAVATVCENRPVKSAVKIWFELEDGTFVEPTLHRWNPKEKFTIHFVSAVPVLVALYQNYPHDDLKSRQVMPDKRFPASFNAVPAGVDYKFPVLFEMDKNLEDEIMSLCLVRADASPAEIITVSATARAEVSTTAGAGFSATAQAEATLIETSAQTTEVTVTKGSERGFAAIGQAAQSSKFRAVGTVVCSQRASGRTADDVAVVILGEGPVTQQRFTLHK